MEREALEAAFAVVLEERDVRGQVEVLGDGRAVRADEVQVAALVVDENPSVRRGPQDVDARGLAAAVRDRGELFQVDDDVALGDGRAGLGLRRGARERRQ